MTVKKVLGTLKKRQTEVFLCLIILLAAVLRFWDVTALGLWPSDAGTYVRMSTWLLGAGGIPMDWEPPMYPISVAVSFAIFGIHDYVAVGTAAAFG
ncbi:MAG: hypothetical protein V1813_02605, partial [Candidatus Aenigmatarchaeota archaeon]